MLERKNATPRRLMMALLLSLLDFTVIQIELNEVAQQVVRFDGLLLTWIFPSPSTAMPFALWLGLLLLRVKAPDKAQARIYAYDWVFAAVFSLILLLGHSFWVCNSYALLTANRSCILLALFSLAGLTGLTVNLLRWAKYGCRRLMAAQVGLPKFWDRHPFLFPFAVIFLLWLPYAVLKYPGGIDFDSYYQLLEPLGLFPLTNHWPVASSTFFAGCYLLGKTLFGSNNAGLFTIVVLQALFCAACMARSLKAMHRLRLNNGLLVLTLAAYSLATIFSRYTTSMGKDCLFACALLLCLSLLAELLLGAYPASPGSLVRLAAACLLLGGAALQRASSAAGPADGAGSGGPSASAESRRPAYGARDRRCGRGFLPLLMLPQFAAPGAGNSRGQYRGSPVPAADADRQICEVLPGGCDRGGTADH